MSTVMLCDSHAHLSAEQYAADRRDVAREALADGLAFIIDVGTNEESWQRSRQLSHDVDGVYGTVGWHPHDAMNADCCRLDETLSAAWWDKAVAVGEIGLDYHYDFSPRKTQCDVFAAQLSFAAAHQRPVVIHIREAWEDGLALLKAADTSAGAVVHCFTGTEANARAVLDLGLYLSFTGVITFPRSHELRDLLTFVPRDRLFFETDSPYLSPPPYRGKRNHPRYVRQVVEVAAEAMGIPFAELAELTTATAARFFGIEGSLPCRS